MQLPNPTPNYLPLGETNRIFSRGLFCMALPFGCVCCGATCSVDSGLLFVPGWCIANIWWWCFARGRGCVGAAGCDLVQLAQFRLDCVLGLPEAFARVGGQDPRPFLFVRGLGTNLVAPPRSVMWSCLSSLHLISFCAVLIYAQIYWPSVPVYVYASRA